jgi:putative aldouronate transport system permease protein
VILTRTYLLSIPDALRDSAKIDGASHFRTLFQIFMPLSKPIIAVLAIYTFVNVWNGWSTANIYLRDVTLQPLQLYLRRMLRQASEVMKPTSPEEAKILEQQRTLAVSLQYAMIIFTTFPVLVVYPFFQKYFVKGVMVGSVKG